MKRVLIIGGYGNFGTFISKSLAAETNIHLIVAGRRLEKAQALADEIGAEAVRIDIDADISAQLKQISPDIVIHTSGPFQGQGYEVAKACMACGANYIDLADGREFVSGITELNVDAEKSGVSIVSGASSVPCLTAALIDRYQTEFKSLESVDYGITTAQKTTRGLATTAAILGYTGKAFETIEAGNPKTLYGWQGLKARKYRELGWRLLGNCNVPDLALFPERYPSLKTIRFYAGLELPFIHFTLWSLSWLVRFKLLKSLKPLAPTLLKLSFLFDCLGTANSGFHMVLKGMSKEGLHKHLQFELIAKEGDGPFIPCMPAILLTKKWANDEFITSGASPCVGMITLDEYLEALASLNINWTLTQGA